MASRPNHQSIRLSCDRCRSQKLKCTVSSEPSRSGTHQCMRCIRAKVECVYGRRAQSRRTSDVKKSDSRQGVVAAEPKMTNMELLQQPRMDVCPPDTMASVPNFLLDSPMATTDAQAWSGEDPMLIRGKTPDGLGMGGVHLINSVASSEGDFWAEFGSTLSQELSLYDTTPSTSSVDSQLPQSPVLFISDELLAASTANATFPANNDGQGAPLNLAELPDRGNLGGIGQLSKLVADIHDTLSILGSGPWSNLCSSTKLNNYPIGRVLGLSQEFVMILHSIWPTKASGSNQNPTSGVGNLSPVSLTSSPPSNLGDQSTVTSKTAQELSFSAESNVLVAPSVDMPTMLLVLSCHVSLTKLYSLVFDHFESNLSRLPEASSPRFSPWGWGLQLGELTSADETPTKICSAVQMLLDAFHSVEEIVGLPNASAAFREQQANGGMEGLELEGASAETNDDSQWSVFLARYVLKKDLGGPHSHDQQDVYKLPSQVQKLKALLRDRMNL